MENLFLSKNRSYSVADKWFKSFQQHEEHTKTYTKTKTKTITKTKCSKDPSHSIFSKSWEFKDIRYDAYNDKDNDQEKDNDNDNDKDKEKDKDKDESAENLNICYIFEKLRIQGYQI